VAAAGTNGEDRARRALPFAGGMSDATAGRGSGQHAPDLAPDLAPEPEPRHGAAPDAPRRARAGMAEAAADMVLAPGLMAGAAIVIGAGAPRRVTSFDRVLAARLDLLAEARPDAAGPGLAEPDPDWLWIDAPGAVPAAFLAASGEDWLALPRR
jgi:hypothetical protein